MGISKLVKKPIRATKVLAVSKEDSVGKKPTIKQEVREVFRMYSGNEFNVNDVIKEVSTCVRRTIEKILVELVNEDYIVSDKCRCGCTKYYRLKNPPPGNPWS